MIDANFVPRRGESTYTVELDGEAVVLDDAEQRLHVLNHSATLLWTVFDGHASIAELAEEIGSELSLPYASVLADAIVAVQDLADEGLLDGIPARAPEAAAP